MYSVWFNQYAEFEQQSTNKQWNAALAPGIVYLTEMAINHYEIDVKKNRDALIDFVGWVDRWPGGRLKKVAYKVATMKRDYGLS
jgi:hypothetical protein